MHLFLTSEDDAVTCLACEGDVSQARFPANSDNPLEELLGAACYGRHVVLDMGHAGFIDSSGVGWLMGCNKRFQLGGGRLVLHSIPPMIEQVLRILQLHTLLTIKPDLVSALAAAVEARGKA